MQMALDEIAARTAANGGPRTIRVYSWEPSTLSLGYSQAADTVDWEYCDTEQITVTRRPTGGGGIYHDRYDDVSYSIVAPKTELPGQLIDCYHLLCSPILTAFQSIDAAIDYTDIERDALYEPACYLRGLHPAHDMVAEDQRKIAGNAEYRQRDAVVHHGSLSFAVSPNTHLQCFSGHDLSRDAFRDRVTAVTDLVDISRDDFVDTVATTLTDWCDGATGEWTDAELAAAEELAATKYSADAWVRDGDNPLAEST